MKPPMSSCRDSRDNIVGIVAPTGGAVVAGIFPIRESRLLLLPTGKSARSKKAKIIPSIQPWPPAEYALPDTIEEIEHGRATQRELFEDEADAMLTAEGERLEELLPSAN